MGKFYSRNKLINLLIAGCCFIVGVFSLSGIAYGFKFDLGNANISFDSTLSVGAGWRIEERDPDLVGFANQPKYVNDPNAYTDKDIAYKTENYGSGVVPTGRWSANGDDGNLNFDKGDPITQIFSITSELDVRLTKIGFLSNIGVFARGQYFYDYYIMTESDDMRVDITANKDAEEQHGTDLKLLDAFLYTNFSAGDIPVGFKIGRQVINWGESAFIAHGLSELNPIDAAQLRSPGAELKEAFIPLASAWLSIGFTESIGLEGFYQFEWDRMKLDAPGTYFSTNDFIGDGGKYVQSSFQMPDLHFFGPYGSNSNYVVERLDDNEASDSGQFGVKVSYFAEALAGAEFGFYYMNYHSRRPVISGYVHDGISIDYLLQKGQPVYAQVEQGAIAQYKAPFAAIPDGTPLSYPLAAYGGATVGQVIAQGLASAGKTQEAQLVTSLSANNPQATNTDVFNALGAAATPVAIAGFTPEYKQGLASSVKATGLPVYGPLDTYAADSPIKPGQPIDGWVHGFIEYPEDIQLYGFSFSSVLPGGISLGGEYSYRIDEPLQIDDVEMIMALSKPLYDQLYAKGLLPKLLGDNAKDFYSQHPDGKFGTSTGPGDYIYGYILRDVSQAQFSLTKIFSNLLGADSLSLLAEFGFLYVHDLPDEDVLRIDADGTVRSGNKTHKLTGTDGFFNEMYKTYGYWPEGVEENSFASDFSCGYVMMAKLDYYNLFAGINVSPKIVFYHDVYGQSPVPISTFIEERMSVALNLNLLYRERVSFDIGGRSYWGAGTANSLSDRDYVYASLKLYF
ncbi:MAG: DUF1302 domain-containing protein [Desulfobacterales bacterium]|nr:DUF1302 domain-containing protein [Desulfobacterales bacterium]